MGRTATSCRSARPRTRRDGRRCRRLPLRLRVELPREESRRRFQDLIRPAQLAVLPLELDQTRSFARRDPVTRTAIDLTLAHPVADRFGMHTELLADLIEAAIVLLPRCTPLVDEPHSTLPNLRRIRPPASTHDFILSERRSLHHTRGASRRVLGASSERKPVKGS